MRRPHTPLILAVVSIILSPVLIMIELIALILAGMITYEPNNSIAVKALSIAVVVALGLLALATPVLALVTGTRARTAAKLAPTRSSGLTTSAIAIAAIVTACVVVAQIYLILFAAGVCSLEGC